MGLKPGSRRACFMAWFLIFLTCDGDGDFSHCMGCPEDEPVDAAELLVVTAVSLLHLPTLCPVLRPLGPFLMTFDLFRLNLFPWLLPTSFAMSTCPWLVSCSAHYSLGLKLDVTSSEQPSLAPI